MKLPALGPGWRSLRPWLLGLGLLLVANVAVAVLLTWPLLNAAGSSGARSLTGQQAQEAVVPALQRARREYGPLLEAEAALQDLREQVAARSGNIADVVSTLRAALDASGLQAERINYTSQPLPQLDLLQIQVELPVRGQYGQLRRFLREVLSAPLFAVVERVGAATPSRDAGPESLNMAVTLSVFAAAADVVPAASGALAAADEPAPVAADPLRAARALGERLDRLQPVPVSVGALRLADLERELQPGEAPQRNLFAFAGAFSPRAIAAAAEAAAAAEQAVALVETPPVPVMPWDLLGITRTLDGSLATLSNGPTVLLVREGELLPDGLRVARIDLEFVVIEAGDQRTRLRLGKEKEE